MNPPIPRALVVEDDRSWQQIVSEIITDCGLDVDVASSLDEAVSILKSQAHRLVVVDLSLSPNDHNNYDGLQVLEAVRRLDPNCKTILLTGFATVELAVTALTQYGTFTFLRKENFQRSQFRELVYRALAAPQQLSTAKTGSSPVSAQIDNLEVLSHATNLPASKAIIVEDDAGWRSILSELMMDAGFQVRACASYGEALGNLRREKFLLAVVDLSLSGSAQGWNETVSSENLEGYQLLTNIRENNIPTIVVSGISSPEEIEKAYAEQSIFAYLEKQTFERANFRRIVEEARATYQANNELSVLTDREREVLKLLAQGMTNKEIAEKLTITTNTVKRHIKAIFEKLSVHTRSAAAAKAMAELA